MFFKEKYNDQGTKFIKSFFTFCLKFLLGNAVKNSINITLEGSRFLKCFINFLEVNRTGMFHGSVCTIS